MCCAKYSGISNRSNFSGDLKTVLTMLTFSSSSWAVRRISLSSVLRHVEDKETQKNSDEKVFPQQTANQSPKDGAVDHYHELPGKNLQEGRLEIRIWIRFVPRPQDEENPSRCPGEAEDAERDGGHLGIAYVFPQTVEIQKWPKINVGKKRANNNFSEMRQLSPI